MGFGVELTLQLSQCKERSIIDKVSRELYLKSSVKSILFVCLGNICRSPLAEGIAKSLAKQKGVDIEIDSAGTSGWHIGEPPCQRSIDVARSNDLDISSLRGRRINPLDMERFELFVVMDSMNYNDMVKVMNFPKERVYKLGSFGFEGKDVPDPYNFSGNEGFDEVYKMIKKGVEMMFTEFRIGS